MQEDLVFDVGMHIGEDSEFYLKKGFKVIAIEADPDHARRNAEKFAREIASGQLVIVNKAIAAEPGRVSFYRSHHNSAWGTLYDTWAERNKLLGDQTAERIEVEAVTMASIYAQYGVPYYLKVDIEGADLLCLEALRGQATRPKHISIESSKTSMAEIRHELGLLEGLGYRKFKVVAQHEVSSQVCPNPPLEGGYVDYRFATGASGLFGAEAPGAWRSRAETEKVYRPIFLRYWLVGDRPISRLGKRVLARLGMTDGWYDTHASL